MQINTVSVKYTYPPITGPPDGPGTSQLRYHTRPQADDDGTWTRLDLAIESDSAT